VSSASSPERRALATAVREAARFDRAALAPVSGLLAAIPVVVVLGGGLALGHPVPAVTMGAGAMLVGIAWRSGGGRPPLTLMATDAFVMGLSTFAGCVTGSVAWIHLVLISLWALAAGLLVCLGSRGAMVGTQAMIAVVVFGRFSEPLGASLGLAASVLAGGLIQVLFQSVVRYPLPLRGQRQATAAAYRVLAGLAVPSADASTLPAAGALDEAEASLASPTLFGDSAIMGLRSLVNEGHRIRVQLSAIQGLIRRTRTMDGDPVGRTMPRAQRVLEVGAGALELAARAVEGDRYGADALPERVAELSAAASHAEEALGRAATDSSSPLARSTALNLSKRIAALAGQLRAVSGLAPAAGEGGGLRSRRPQQRTNRPLERLRADVDQLRANMSLRSPAGRHAVRLAVVVLVAELISRQLPLQRSYWLVVAAASVLRPEFGATFTRGTERALGTCLGVGLAGAITVALHPTEGVTVVIVGLLAWAAYATFTASWAVGFGFITAVVVFLLNAISPDTLATASARLLDSLVGSTLGLIAWALWPTWSKQPARQSLASLVGAERDYVDAVLSAVTQGRQADEGQMRSLARHARLARTNAEAAVARSLAEPATRRIDAEDSQRALATLRRLIQAVHVLRLDAEEERQRPALPELKPLAAVIDWQLREIDTVLSDAPGARPGSPSLPDLRASYSAFERHCSQERDHAALLAELDEIVDAANSLAELAGLDRVDHGSGRRSDGAGRGRQADNVGRGQR
jgi:uncharacterized membrane protein YccC